MALTFSAQGSYYGKRTTSLGTSTSDTTVMCLFRSPSGTTQQGTVFGMKYTTSVSGNYNIVSNGSSLYLGVDTGYISAFSLLPSTTVWYIAALRRSSSLNSGKWYGSIYNGSTWTSINGSSGAGSATLDKLWAGFETGDDFLRDYCVNGLEVAHMRVWNNTHLSDAELEAEAASHVPIVSGVTCAFTCVDDGVDSEGGDSLSISGTNASYNSNDPAPAGNPTPDTGSIVSTTYDLSVDVETGPIAFDIDVGTLAITTYDLVDSTGNNIEIFVGLGSETYTTYSFGLDVSLAVPYSEGPADQFPDDGNAIIEGYAPSIDTVFIIDVGVYSINILTYEPTINVQSSANSIAIDVGTIISTGYAPDDINAYVPSPTTGTITFTSYTPTIDVTHVRDIGVGSITTTTYTPSVSADSNTTILMDVGATTYTGYAPTLSFGIGRHPDAGSITFTSYTPDAISEDVSWEFFPDEGSATYSTYDLTLSIIEVNKSIPIAVGSLVIPGWKPPFGSNPSVEVGARKRRKILGFLK